MKKYSQSCEFSAELRFRQVLRGAGLASVAALLIVAKLQQTGAIDQTRIPNIFHTIANPFANSSVPTATRSIDTYIPEANSTTTVNIGPSKKAIKLPINWSLESGVITNSFNAATQTAGLTAQEKLAVTKILGEQIDFRHLHQGDNFKVITSRIPAKGKQAAQDRIIAIDFTANHQHYQAISYRNANGTISFYRPDGSSLETGFLRYPTHFTAIGSGFSRNRLDPVTGRYHAHPAIDFDAPMGTPIVATSNGQINFAGYQNGYGNVVKINHPGHIMTLYAHMRNFAKGIHAGSAVKEGQVIGYVGMTGETTGPHVHYEFHVGNTPMNPLTVKLPNVQSLSGQAKQSFMQQIEDILAIFKKS